MRLKLLPVVVSILFLGFSVKAEKVESHSTETTANGRTVVELNGSSPEEFYKQFHYYLHTAKDGGKWHQQIHSGVNRAFDRINLGNGKYADIKMFMFADGTFEYEYSEWKATGTGGNLLFSKAGKSKWKIQGSDLVFEGLGKAKGGTMETKVEGVDKKLPIISFQFDKDIKSPGITEGMIVMTRAGTTSGPGTYEDKSYDESVYNR